MIQTFDFDSFMNARDKLLFFNLNLTISNLKSLNLVSRKILSWRV